MVNLADTFGERVISHLEDEEGNPTFSTAQELLKQLVSLTGMNYDSATGELTAELDFDRTYTQSIPMTFDVDTEDLVDVRVDEGQFIVDASIGLGLIIGF